MLSRGMKIGLWVVAGGALVSAMRRPKKASRKTASTSPSPSGDYPYPRPRTLEGVPFAGGPAVPAFPVSSSSKHSRRLDISYKDVDGKYHGRWGRIFGASRRDGARYHVGIDVFADPGDVIVAPEDGLVVGVQNFLTSIDGSGPDAMLIRGDSGVTVLLGEIDENAFGVKVGDRVSRGQPVAKIQATAGGDHMLHFETYRNGVTHNEQWWKGSPPPPDLLDPTDYLLRAKFGEEHLA
jgi:murein DD-endopeptidase MepM/ murein hydrolase activator NlpD